MVVADRTQPVVMISVCEQIPALSSEPHAHFCRLDIEKHIVMAFTLIWVRILIELPKVKRATLNFLGVLRLKAPS